MKERHHDLNRSPVTEMREGEFELAQPTTAATVRERGNKRCERESRLVAET